MLLLVRDTVELNKAVISVNEFRDLHRKRSASPQGPILGVWLRPELDAGLPTAQCAEIAAEKTGAHQGTNGSSQRAATAIKISESVSRSGLWTLCCLQGVVSHAAQQFAHDLQTIVDSLIVPYSDDECRFFPVFRDGDPPEQIRANMRLIRQNHPGLIADTWFVENSRHGLLAADSSQADHM